MTDPVVVRVTRTFNAPAERVFDSWLDPAAAAEWLAAGMGELAGVEIDARKGGRFRFDQARGGRIIRHTGEYLTLDRPRRLVFTWNSEGLSGLSVVSVEIEPLGGRCRLTLAHRLEGAYAPHARRAEEQWRVELEAMGGLLN